VISIAFVNNSFKFRLTFRKTCWTKCFLWLFDTKKTQQKHKVLVCLTRAQRLTPIWWILHNWMIQLGMIRVASRGLNSSGKLFDHTKLEGRLNRNYVKCHKNVAKKNRWTSRRWKDRQRRITSMQGWFVRTPGMNCAVGLKAQPTDPNFS